jgi:hypothetical protein
VTPELVSKVSNEETSEHGAVEPVAKVTSTDPTISARELVVATFEKGTLTEKTCPVVIVKLVAVPIAAPVEPAKEIAPVQDAAVPEVEVLALFRTLICALSVLPMPTGPKSKV